MLVVAPLQGLEMPAVWQQVYQEEGTAGLICLTEAKARSSVLKAGMI